ncbi:hypothetical protein KM043_001970 [Ampulex compressa]|nr:hypothetical protein KM043_001970 [Ampulex compressa]
MAIIRGVAREASSYTWKEGLRQGPILLAAGKKTRVRCRDCAPSSGARGSKERRVNKEEGGRIASRSGPCRSPCLVIRRSGPSTLPMERHESGGGKGEGDRKDENAMEEKLDEGATEGLSFSRSTMHVPLA